MVFEFCGGVAGSPSQLISGVGFQSFGQIESLQMNLNVVPRYGELSVSNSGCQMQSTSHFGAGKCLGSQLWDP